MSALYGKNQRLLSKKDFSNLFTQSNKSRSDGTTIIYKSNNLGSSRLGISISRKVCNAVKRNRIKRVTREIFRMYTSSMKHVDYLVIVYKPVHCEGEFRSNLKNFFK